MVTSTSRTTQQTDVLPVRLRVAQFTKTVGQISRTALQNIAESNAGDVFTLPEGQTTITLQVLSKETSRGCLTRLMNLWLGEGIDFNGVSYHVTLDNAHTTLLVKDSA